MNRKRDVFALAAAILAASFAILKYGPAWLGLVPTPAQVERAAPVNDLVNTDPEPRYCVPAPGVCF